MAPDAPLKGTVLAAGLPDNGEIVQRLKDVMELQKDLTGAVIKYEFPVLRCTPMRLDPGFVEFVSPSPFPVFSFHSSSRSFFT
jgi:hypothetical protein